MDSAGASVAVVIPSWNSIDLLPACLESVGRQEVPLELMVVDNGSHDGSVEYLESNGIPHITLPHNVGFAVAMNLAVSRTAAPLVLALNADTVLEPGCVGELAAALAADPRLGGVQPRILQLEGGSADVASARLYSAGQGLTRDGRAVEIGAGEPQSSSLLRAREIFGVCGAACLLRRELFTELAGYDESYFSFYEDVDLNVRAQIRGWRFRLAPEAVVWHVGNASWEAGFTRPGAENARLVARNRLSTQVKFMSVAAVPLIAAIEVGALWRATRERRLGATLRGKLEAIGRIPASLRARRALRRDGDPARARAWLGRREIG
jgi:GT2 family glycosyltransferase